MTSPSSPGWYADPESPATLQRWYDGERWTDESRPTGYVTQPGGPAPVAATAGQAAPVFGATPPPSGDPRGPRRRMRTAVVATSVAVGLALLAGLLVLLGVL